MSARRRNHYDVTNTVCICDPRTVCNAVCDLLGALYPDADLQPVRCAFETFGRLYTGTLPGYLGCDTWYHDAQHSLDCTLAMVRLLDGYERSVPARERLGARRAVLGVIVALFHDAGYIRRSDDKARNGAEYTLTHVRRSGDFLAHFLPTVGLAADAELARRIVHFTGYEIALDQIQVRHPKDRRLGFMLGTADVLAQTADRCYLEKCRDFLFREFALCGLAGDGHDAVYRSPEDLLAKTVDFNRKLWQERLDAYFQSVHRYLDAHFGGRNPYVEQIHAHLVRIDCLVRENRLDALRLRPVAIGAQALRKILSVRQPERARRPQRLMHRARRRGASRAMRRRSRATR